MAGGRPSQLGGKRSPEPCAQVRILLGAQLDEVFVVTSGLGQARPGPLVRMQAPARPRKAGWAAARAYEVRTVVDLWTPGSAECT